MNSKTNFMMQCPDCGSKNLWRAAEILYMSGGGKADVFIPYYATKCRNCNALRYSYHKTNTKHDCAYSVRWVAFGKDDAESFAGRPHKFDREIWFKSHRACVLAEYLRDATIEDLEEALALKRLQKPLPLSA